jgi:hypothetical protein
VPLQRTAVRFLNLHEYQSKALMNKYNVRVQKGEVASTPEEAEQVAERLLKAAKGPVRQTTACLTAPRGLRSRHIPKTNPLSCHRVADSFLCFVCVSL